MGFGGDVMSLAQGQCGIHRMIQIPYRIHLSHGSWLMVQCTIQLDVLRSVIVGIVSWEYMHQVDDQLLLE